MIDLQKWPSLLPEFPALKPLLDSLHFVEVCPSHEEIFAAYNFTSQEDVKVVILGEEPQASKEAIGLSYGRRSKCIGPELRAVMNSLRKSGYLPEGRPESADLTTWATQGVLLLNSVLSAERGYIYKHKERGWEHFTGATLLVLSKSAQPVVFMLWGSSAQTFGAQYIEENSTNLILRNVHPLAETYGVQNFSDQKDFERANAWLTLNNLKQIEWDTCSKTTQ